MRTLNRSLTFAALALTWTLGCGDSPEAPPVRSTIGVHDVTFETPELWLHLDHGLQHRFQRDIAQISLTDAGPATSGAFLREVEHARELFRRNQREDARDLLDELRFRSAFSEERRWRAFVRSWNVARDGGLKRSYLRDEIETAYAAMIAEIETLPTPELPELVERVLQDHDHGAQRDIARKRRLTVDGCQGLWLETWDRLSHDHRRHYLFVLNEGNLLVARMELGRFDEMQAAFAVLVDSLRIHPPQPDRPS